MRWRVGDADVRLSLRFMLGAAAAVVGGLLLGWSDGHYWDEYLYLYSAFAHSPAELVRYELETTLFPVGFFSEKIGHVALLRLLTVWLGPGEKVLYALEALYALFLVGLFGAAYGLLRELMGERRARDSVLVLMLSPLALYLSFKVMSEVPSLLLATLGSWSFVRSFREEAPHRTPTLLALATVGLAAGMLFRVTTIVSFGGLGLALLIAGDERFARRRLLLRLLAVGVGTVILHTAGLALAGGSVLRVGSHIHNVLTTHPPLQRVFALALFVQTLALALVFAWRSRSEPGTRMAWVWFAASGLPFLAGHEPRYYITALIPLAVLAAAGLRGAADLLFGPRFRQGWVVLLAALALVNRLILFPLMPYEVQQGPLLALFRTASANEPRATYLIPWITDYSLLRFGFPVAHIELSLSPTPESRYTRPGHGGELAELDQWWAGHYVGARPALTRQPAPWYFIGWTYNPAALSLQRLLRPMGLERLVRKGPQLHNHIAGSWIWHDRSLTLTLRDRLGQYYMYQVDARSSAVGPTVP